MTYKGKLKFCYRQYDLDVNSKGLFDQYWAILHLTIVANHCVRYAKICLHIKEVL